MLTSDELREEVFNKCLDLIDNREDQYGDHWRVEPESWYISNIERKYNGLMNQLRKVPLDKIDPEILLDLINYCGFLERRRQINCGLQTS